MRKIFFMLGFITIVGLSLSSCSSFDETEYAAPTPQSEVAQTRTPSMTEDAAMQDFFSNVDELCTEYAKPSVYGIGAKCGKGILIGAADATAGAIGYAVGSVWGACKYAVKFSIMYADYLNYIEKKMAEPGMETKGNLYAPNLSGPVDPKAIDGVVFNRKDMTLILADTTRQLKFVDSVGCHHNNLITSLRKSNKSYVDANGKMDIDGLNRDLQHKTMFIKLGTVDDDLDSIAQENLQKNDIEAIESATRQFETSFIRSFDPSYDIDFAKSYKIARMNSLDKLNIDKSLYDDIGRFSERIITMSSHLSNTEVINFCKGLDTRINASNLDNGRKNIFKIYNNIFANSFYYWE